jgi:acyl-CoA synthetase (AMP-forming)/AMP-acid ligase II
MQTLAAILNHRARATPDRTAFTFDGQPCTFKQLHQRAYRFANFLITKGVGHGDRVVIVLPTGPDFFTVFYGSQIIGAVAVPVFPDSGPQRILSTAALCDAKAIVLPSEIAADQLTKLPLENNRQLILTPAEARKAAPSLQPAFPAVKPDDLCFIQYTSGSTGNPKGVQLTQGNLMTNIGQLIEGMEITPKDVFVSWLPVYHDMGLILMTMVPFYLAADLYLLPTRLTNIRLWLDTLSTYRATFTAAPDFAYRLCLRYIKNPGDYDLASLRVALNAAEPVRARTVQAFESMFRINNVMTAGYGLAEATVGVSMSRPGKGIPVDDRGFASVGPPFRGIEIKIMDGGRRLEPGQVGEIAIKSPASCRGYFGNPQATADLFIGNGFFASGDLGYLAENGELFIVGRKKNIIIRHGQNIAPSEMEEIVDAFPEVRFSAAVGIDKGGTEGEQAYVFAELRNSGPQTQTDFEDLIITIVERIKAQMSFRPARVYLLRPRSIPMTHNGKIQHGRLKDHYESGSLHRQGAIIFPDY